MNLLEESVSDNLEHLETSKDEDAKTGHKTADTSFFGYKTHIAMTEERIITAAAITSGEKADGKELPALVRKSRDAGMEVESVIGGKAYSDKKNIEEAKDGGYKLTARLNSIVTQGNRSKEDEFEFNKDAGMYQCKGGHLAVHKYLDRRQKEKKNKNPRMVYFFDVEKCKCCPYKEGCYKDGTKKKTYSETLICDEHSEQAEFQIGRQSTRGYQQQTGGIGRNKRKSRFSLGKLAGDVIVNSLLGGFTSTMYYGADRAVGAVSDGIRGRRSSQQRIVDSEVGSGSSKYQKARFWERITKRSADINELYANPRIGPCEPAVSKYIKEINQTGKLASPIEVQKLANGGYEIVNGHHRWLAATKTGLKKVPIRIKNYSN